MKYFWVKIEDQYDWFEYIVFADNKEEVKLILDKKHDNEFTILKMVENTTKAQAIMTRQGCD